MDYFEASSSTPNQQDNFRKSAGNKRKSALIESGTGSRPSSIGKAFTGGENSPNSKRNEEVYRLEQELEELDNKSLKNATVQLEHEFEGIIANGSDKRKNKISRVLVVSKLKTFQVYLAGGSRILLLLLFSFDISWIIFYYIEREDVICFGDGVNWYQTPRTNHQLTLFYQVVISYILIIWTMLNLIMFGRQYFLGVPVTFLSVVICLPFIASVGSDFAKDLYVPSYLRIWSSYKVLVQMLALTDQDTTWWSRLIIRFSPIIRIIYIILAFLITGMCGFRWTANCIGAKPPVQRSFIDSGYFMIVTISTVGYGDIAPTNIASRVFVLCYIILALLFLPKLVQDMIDLLKEQKDDSSVYNTWFDKVGHMVVIGDMKLSNINPFIAYARYFVEKTNDFNMEFPNLVLLSQNSLERSVKRSLDAPGIDRLFHFISGNSLRTKDLKRAKLKKAKVCFIVKDDSAFQYGSKKDLMHYDKDNIMRAWSVFLNSTDFKFTAYVYLNKVENRRYLELPYKEKDGFFSNVNIKTKFVCLCEDELKLSLIGLDALFPGTSALLFTLSVQPSNKDLKAYNSVCYNAWSKEYLRSMRQSIFPIPVSSFKNIAGISYKYLMKLMYKKTFSLLVGLKSAEQKEIRLNPSQYIIEDIDILYIMSWSNCVVTLLLPWLRGLSHNCTSVHKTAPEDGVENDIKVENLHININSRSISSDIGEGTFSNSTTMLTTSRTPSPTVKNNSTLSFNNNSTTSLGMAADASASAIFTLQYTNPLLVKEDVEDNNETVCLDYHPIPYPGAVVYRCHLSKTPRALSDCIITHTKHVGSGHIIVFTNQFRLYHFLARLRRATIPYSYIKDIVILSTELPTEDEWCQYNRFVKVWLLQGNLTNTKTLKNAGVDKASSFVILSEEGGDPDDPVGDSYAVLGTKIVEDNNCRPPQAPPLHVITDVCSHRSLKFLCNDFNYYRRIKTGSQWDYMFEESFYTGKVWSNHPLANLLVTMFVKPHVFEIISNIAGTKRLAEGFHTLIKIKVPEFLHFKSAQEVLSFYYDNFEAILFGIQRGVNETLNNVAPYSVLNPHPDYKIFPSDHIFLLQRG